MIIKILLFLLLCTGVVLPTYAQERPVNVWSKTVSGTLTKVENSGNTITIRTVDQRNLIFTVPTNAVITHEMRRVKLMDLKKGDPVSVQYDTFSPNKFIVTRIKG